MADKVDQCSSQWKEICVYTNKLHQSALEGATRAIHRENIEDMKRMAKALVECLDQLQTNHKRETVLIPSIYSKADFTPPPSPIALSPATTPREVEKMEKDSSILLDISYSSDDEVSSKVHLPPINTQQYHSQPISIPLSPPLTFKWSSSRPALGGLAYRKDDPPSPTRPASYISALPSLAKLSISQSPSNNFSRSPIPPTSCTTTHSYNNSNIPPPAIASSLPRIPPPSQPIAIPRTPCMAVVITQPIATICEVPGFKKRGRPSTRIDNQCVECGTHRTPEWRRGEGGVHLCNACGLQYSKRVRRERAERKRNSIAAILFFRKDSNKLELHYANT